MNDKKRCCANCEYYVKKDGELVCNDYDGLYFNWSMKPGEKCPDFVFNKEKEEKVYILAY